mmetsp:Transcript_45821/g.93771  ORF Transcript_45821/g.93771 Transcript_45821/m.93771 type:complete len:205 (+) Transcript_45821:2-616(+)
MEMIVKYYRRKGFPPGFVKALRKFKCAVCDVCKGARNYRHTKRVLDKMAAKSGAPATEAHPVDVDDNRTAEDDLENMFDEENVLHMDFAYSISLGKHNEKYFLIFVVGGVNFLWAAPTASRATPEDLLRDFLAETRLKIGRLRVDGEFSASASFKAFSQILAVGSSAFLQNLQLLAIEGRPATLGTNEGQPHGLRHRTRYPHVG